MRDYSYHTVSSIINAFEKCVISHFNESKMWLFYIQVQASPFVITTDAEYRVLRDRALQLGEQNKEVQRSMDEIQHQYSLLKGKKTKHSQRTIQQLVLQTGEQEAELKEVCIIPNFLSVWKCMLFVVCWFFTKITVIRKKLWGLPPVQGLPICHGKASVIS